MGTGGHPEATKTLSFVILRKQLRQKCGKKFRILFIRLFDFPLESPPIYPPFLLREGFKKKIGKKYGLLPNRGEGRGSPGVVKKPYCFVRKNTGVRRVKGGIIQVSPVF